MFVDRLRALLAPFTTAPTGAEQTVDVSADVFERTFVPPADGILRIYGTISGAGGLDCLTVYGRRFSIAPASAGGVGATLTVVKGETVTFWFHGASSARSVVFRPFLP